MVLIYSQNPVLNQPISVIKPSASCYYSLFCCTILKPPQSHPRPAFTPSESHLWSISVAIVRVHASTGASSVALVSGVSTFGTSVTIVGFPISASLAIALFQLVWVHACC